MKGAGDQLKINLGCGRDYRPGWLNVDFYASACPDVVFDLEQTPWPLDSDCADSILLKHVLEHLGKDSRSFLSIISELYRIAKPGALLEIHVPHPLHADFLGDPTHVRPIVPEMFQCFNLALVEQWQAAGLPGTPLAKYIGVDFETIDVTYFLDQYWQSLLSEGKIQQPDLVEKARSSANVIQWMRIMLRARKPFRHGRSLDQSGAICLRRDFGLGDVLMALGAANALKELTGKPVFLRTSDAFREVAEACPLLDGVVVGEEALASLEADFRGRGGVRHVDLTQAKFGISGRHQIDAYLDQLGLTANAGQKEIVLDSGPGRWEAEAFLASLPPRVAGGKRVLVHPALTDPNRTWPQRQWAEVCERLCRDGHQVILIGNSSNVPNRGVHCLDIEGVANAVDRLSLLGTLALMDASDVLLSTDSGPIQLAGATSISIIGLYTVVAGKDRVPFRHGQAGWNAKALAPECPHSPCYRWMHDADVLSRTEATNPKLLFSDWCLAPVRYDCMSSQLSVGDVLDAFCDAIRTI